MLASSIGSRWTLASFVSLQRGVAPRAPPLSPPALASIWRRAFACSRRSDGRAAVTLARNPERAIAPATAERWRFARLTAHDGLAGSPYARFAGCRRNPRPFIARAGYAGR